MDNEITSSDCNKS